MMRNTSITAVFLCIAGLLMTSCGADESDEYAKLNGEGNAIGVRVEGSVNEVDSNVVYRSVNEFGEDFQFAWSKFSIQVSYPGHEESIVEGLLIATGWAPSRLASIGPPIAISDAANSESIEEALEEYPTLGDAIEANPKSLIINAGLVRAVRSNDRSIKSAGLFYVNGILVSASAEDISGIVCVTDKERQVAIYRTRSFSNASQIGNKCRSAVQAFPVLVNSGKVAIRSTEISKVKPKARVIAAVTPKRGTFFLVMKEPANLLPVAELLAVGETPNVRLVRASRPDVVDEYFGNTTAAINLPSGESAIAAADGVYLTKGDTRSVRAALILDPTPTFP